MKNGKVIIISAPSGTGKSTIISRLLVSGEIDMHFSISATNRPPRGQEQHGREYYFLSDCQMRDAIANDEFVEYEEVYPGRFYGTLKSEITRITEAEKSNVILDIDVKGGLNVKKLYGAKAISIFIKPPSIDELRRRLEARATESAEEIDSRIGKAEYEISLGQGFDYTVVNDDLEEASRRVAALIKDFVQ